MTFTPTPRDRWTTPEQRNCDHRDAKSQVGEQSKMTLWVCGSCGLRFTHAHLAVNPWDEAAVSAAREANIVARGERLDRLTAMQHRNGDGKK